MISHAFMLYEMQALVAAQIDNFVKYPPRQKPASFNLDAVMRQVHSPTSRRRQAAWIGMPSRRRYAPSTSGIPIHRPSTAWRRTGACGRTRSGAARTFISPGPRRPTVRIGRSWSRAAGRRRRPNTPCAGPPRVIGIDFSATSVRHTEALKRKYDLDNLEVHQLPVERIGALG